MASSNEPPDELLVSRIKNGEQGAFTFIYERYFQQISLFLFKKTGRFEDSEDLAQETFIKAERGLPQLRQNSSLRKWLYKIARTTLLDSIRKQDRRISSSSIEMIDEIHTTEDSLEDHFIAREEMEQHLNTLPQKQRECLILCTKNYSIAEIACKLQLTEQTVHVYISTARKSLRALSSHHPENV